ncbi:MAG: hypothetical protein WD278_18955 [Pirellulales bacterium]
MIRNCLLLAVDSVGIDPKGHDRAESVYGQSSFLFPKGRHGELIELDNVPIEGALVETDVTAGQQRGGIECALTYTAHFTGQDAASRHGLLQGLGLNERLLQEMVAQNNLFRLFHDPCLANAIFPAHLAFFGASHVSDLMASYSREQVEEHVRFRGRPVRLLGKDKHGFAELFTLSEINQNIFLHAARQAGLPLATWHDVRRGQALTSSMTHQLESDFDWSLFGQEALPLRSCEQAADVLWALVEQHSFVFYKYQLADLVAHSGRLELARDVFETIERFVEALLQRAAGDSFVVVTSDHGHLEQVEYHHGHPKTKVPTWCFGPDAAARAAGLRKPQAIYDLFAGFADEQRRTPSQVTGSRPA